MKKLLPLLLTTACLSSSVYASPAYLDVSAATTQGTGSGGSTPGFGGDIDTFTSIFNQLQLFAETTTTQYDTDASSTVNTGDKFTDIGSAAITDLLPPLGDDEGIGSLSEITVSWTGLTGVITSELTPTGSNFTQNFAYDTTNTVFEFFFHGDSGGPDGAPDSNFGASIGSADNSGFTNGEKILEIAITGGAGTNTFDGGLEFVSGSSILSGEITFALNDFWWFDDGDNIAGTPGDKEFEDLLGLAVPVILHTSIDQNTDQVELDTSIAGTPGPAGFGDALFNLHSSHDGSIDFQVPEPGTLFLLGAGLVLIPGIRRSIAKKTRV